MDTENQLNNTKKISFSSLKDLRILFLTFFGTGLSPVAPGTVGSIATLILLYFISFANAPFFFFIPFVLLLTVGAVFITKVIEREYECADPSWIVIDEVIGMWIASMFLSATTLTHFLIIFLLFRFFDILKPWPVNAIDARKDAIGTIFDDVAAGLMAGVTYRIGIFLLQNYA